MSIIINANSADMANELKRVIEAHGCADSPVVVIWTTPQRSARPRGHSALLGMADLVIEATDDRALRVLKSRDGVP